MAGNPLDGLDAISRDLISNQTDISRNSWYTDFVRNVTISLDDDVARWARIEAARQDTSVSRLVAGLLRERMIRELRFEQARQSYLAQAPSDLSSGSAHYPTRSELHER